MQCSHERVGFPDCSGVALLVQLLARSQCDVIASLAGATVIETLMEQPIVNYHFRVGKSDI